ncbi:MAG: pirin family protein [Magnetococcales bacterium]|nr:pirin family protein [Magnetococcales bacterium]
MITIRRACERGAANHGWLDTRHTFSFAEYFDPNHMGFRSLRVVNEDVIQPGTGFDWHGHRDMEVISFLIRGALQHRDSTGVESVLRAGQVQCMTAGSGIRHSEHNPSSTEPTHFLQIWILPERQGLPPGYQQKGFPAEERRGRFCLIASPDGADQSLPIHQDVRLFGLILEPGTLLSHVLDPGRHAWVQVVSGEVEINGQRLFGGDGLALSQEREVRVVGCDHGEILLFDLA